MTLSPAPRNAAEVWNFGFSQFGVNVAAANASVLAGDPHHFNQSGTNVWQWAGFRYVYMLTHIGSIFEGVFGAGSVGRNRRVRPVYAWQQGDFQEQGIAYLVHALGIAPPAALHSIAFAPYLTIFPQDFNNPSLTADEVLAGWTGW